MLSQRENTMESKSLYNKGLPPAKNADYECTYARAATNASLGTLILLTACASTHVIDDTFDDKNIRGHAFACGKRKLFMDEPAGTFMAAWPAHRALRYISYRSNLTVST